MHIELIGKSRTPFTNNYLYTLWFDAFVKTTCISLLDVIYPELIFSQNDNILPCLQHYSIDGETALECKFL